MKLFDNIKRINSNPAQNNENIYNYLNNSDRIEINIVREELENWFKRYSREEKIEIKQRIKTNEQFDSVFFEMYLYELFYKMNFDIESHPKMESSKNKPDFLLTKNKKKIYIEAKIDYNLSEELQRLKNSKNHVLDSINSIKSNKYRIFLIEKKDYVRISLV